MKTNPAKLSNSARDYLVVVLFAVVWAMSLVSTFSPAGGPRQAIGVVVVGVGMFLLWRRNR